MDASVDALSATTGAMVEEEDEAEDEGEAEAPEDGADGQPQPDRASSNEPRQEKATAAGGDQAETAQPADPTSDTAVTSEPVCCLLGCHLIFVLSALIIFEELFNSHNSTRGVYFEILLEDSAKGLCYVNIHPTSIFSCSLLFWLFPLPSSLTCRLCQSDSRSAECCWIKFLVTLGRKVLSRF